jgi:hypothetical protein
MTQVGNERFNAVCEAQLRAGIKHRVGLFSKPNATSTVEHKSNFVKAKYISLAYIDSRASSLKGIHRCESSCVMSFLSLS